MYKNESCVSCKGMSARLARMPANVRTAVRAVLHVCAALLCASMAFIFAACDFFTPTWNEPVGEWFRKYTNEAAIDRHVFSSFYTGTDGLSCVSTESDCTVTFYMRNPQNYDLAPQCSFSGGIGAPSSSIPTIVQDASDRSMLRMTLPQQFLRDNDIGKDGAKPVEINVRIGQDWDDENMRYLREFGSYSFSFVCNSAPPALEGAVVYKEAGGSGSYVVFFNAPDKALMKERHSDVEVVSVTGKNGGKYNVTVEDDGEMTFRDAVFTKVSVSDINDTAKYTPALALNTFTHISGRDIWCYNTGDASSSEATFTLSLVDRLGVANTVHASTSRLKLGEPTIDGKDACSNDFTTLAANILAYAAQTESGASLQSTGITVKAPTKAYGNVEALLDDVQGITIHWSLNGTGQAGTEQAGTGKDSVEVTIAPGTWTLTAHAEHASYDRSDDVSYTVVLPDNIYVAEDGTGRGTAPNDAVPSLSDAITIIKNINPSAVPVDFTIHVSGKIDDTAVKIEPTDNVYAKTLTIAGTNENKDILCGNNTDTVLFVSQHNRGDLLGANDKRIEEVIVKDITITNGTRGVHIKGTNFTMKGNTVITRNTSTDSGFVGSGVFFDEDGSNNVGNITFTMEGGAIRGNTSKNDRACYGVDVAVGTTNSNRYKKLTFIMKGGVIGSSSTFTDAAGNKNALGQGSVAIGGTCSMYMSEHATIKGVAGADGVHLHKATLAMCDNAVIGEMSATQSLRYGVMATQGSTVYLGYDDTLKEKKLTGGIFANEMGGIHVSGYRSSTNLLEYLSYVYMDSGTVSKNEGPGITLDKYASFTMSGGAISDNTAHTQNKEKGGGVAMQGTSTTFTMTDGRIEGNYACYGGGVYMYASSASDCTFTMSGGTISGNTAKYDTSISKSGNGGGIMVLNGVFTMTGGTIADNTANVNGGGVFLERGTFTMKGGVIGKEQASSAATETETNHSNYAHNGGGVVVDTNGTFTQEAGFISYNYAGKDSDGNGGCGGGVYALGTVILKGTVQYNGSAEEGGGVHYCVGKKEKSFTMDGNAAIINNMAKNKGGGLYFNDLHDSIGTTLILRGGKIKRNGGSMQDSKQYYMAIGGTDSDNPDRIIESSNDVENVSSISLP